MPYSSEHKRDTREKIIESARRLFNRKGYSGVSIEDIMSDAGLTHGGFYRHFSGKDELYAAAVRQFLCKKTPAAWQAKRRPTSVGAPRARRIVEAYFSREHFDDRDGCCPLIGMASDIQRGGEAVKVAYQEVVEQLIKVFEDHVRNQPKRCSEKRVMSCAVRARGREVGQDFPDRRRELEAVAGAGRRDDHLREARAARSMRKSPSGVTV